jgi:hypothetical protein
VIPNSALLSFFTHAGRLCAGNLARSFRLIRNVFPWATPLRRWHTSSTSEHDRNNSVSRVHRRIMAAIERASSWLDAHNRQDMNAIDCYTEDIEIVEMPTGVVYKGMAKMRELPRMAYRRKGWKDLTHIIATETERVWSMSRELTCPCRSPRRRKRAASMESIYRKTNQAPRPSQCQCASSVASLKRLSSWQRTPLRWIEKLQFRV